MKIVKVVVTTETNWDWTEQQVSKIYVPEQKRAVGTLVGDVSSLFRRLGKKIGFKVVVEKN